MPAIRIVSVSCLVVILLVAQIPNQSITTTKTIPKKPVRFWDMAFVSVLESTELYLGKLDLKTELSNPEGGGGPGFWGDTVKFKGLTQLTTQVAFPRFSHDGKTLYLAELLGELTGEHTHEKVKVAWWQRDNLTKQWSLVSQPGKIPLANHIFPDRRRLIYLGDQPKEDRQLNSSLVPELYRHCWLALSGQMFLLDPRTGKLEYIGESDDPSSDGLVSLAPIPKAAATPPGWLYLIFDKNKLYKFKADGTARQFVRTLSHQLLSKTDWFLDKEAQYLYYIGYRDKQPSKLILEDITTGSWQYCHWDDGMTWGNLYSPDQNQGYLSGSSKTEAQFFRLTVSTGKLERLKVGISFDDAKLVDVYPVEWKLDGSLELKVRQLLKNPEVFKFYRYHYLPTAKKFIAKGTALPKSIRDLVVVAPDLSKRVVLAWSSKSQWLSLETQITTRNYLYFVAPLAFSPDGKWLAFKLRNSRGIFVDNVDKAGLLHQAWDGILTDESAKTITMEDPRFDYYFLPKIAWRSR